MWHHGCKWFASKVPNIPCFSTSFPHPFPLTTGRKFSQRVRSRWALFAHRWGGSLKGLPCLLKQVNHLQKNGWLCWHMLVKIVKSSICIYIYIYILYTLVMFQSVKLLGIYFSHSSNPGTGRPKKNIKINFILGVPRRIFRISTYFYGFLWIFIQVRLFVYICLLFSG